MIFCSFMIAETENNQDHVQRWFGQFLETEKGQWLREHCPNLSYTVTNDPEYWGYKVTVLGKLSPEDETYFTLKFK